MTCRTCREEEKCVSLQCFGGETSSKGLFGRPRREWKNNIKLLRKDNWRAWTWLGLTEDRNMWLAVVNTVKNLLGP
jgi:hypothetical protein